MYRPFRLNMLTAVAAALIILSACTKEIMLPPLNAVDTGEYHHGKFVWHDLLTDNPVAASSFYEDLFGWEFKQAAPEDNRYFIISHKGKSIGGMVSIENLKKEVEYSQWLPYLSVADVDNTVKDFVDKGGNIEREPIEMPNRGRFAAVTDPQGAVLALIKSSTGDPAEREPVLNEWLWNELWAENKDDALKFYMEIFGYKEKEVEALDSSLYHTLHLDEKARAGILEIPIAKVNPHWLTYIAVDDVAETKTKAEELGGAVLVFVEGTKRGAAAIIADPSGAVFGIQKWPIEREDAK